MTMNDSNPPKRRWYQFSLRTLVVLLLVGCVVCWIGARIHQARRNRERGVPVVKQTLEKAVAEIEELGGLVIYKNEQQRPATWLEDLFDDPGGPDDPVEVLNVAEVDLGDTKITDAGLEHLRELPQLQSLNLSDTKITDAGLKHLQGLGNIRTLNLRSTAVTDAGLKHLQKLAKLSFLRLDDANVTDEGVKELQQALPNCGILYTKSR